MFTEAARALRRDLDHLSKLMSNIEEHRARCSSCADGVLCEEGQDHHRLLANARDMLIDELNELETLFGEIDHSRLAFCLEGEPAKRA